MLKSRLHINIKIFIMFVLNRLKLQEQKCDKNSQCSYIQINYKMPVSHSYTSSMNRSRAGNFTELSAILIEPDILGHSFT